MSEKTNVISGKFGKRAPENLAADLRALADAVERGEVTAFAGAYIENGEYALLFGASLEDALVLSTLLHTRSVEKFRA